MPACLRRGEVAGLLQVSVWTVDRMAANGEIRKVKFGRAARFVRAEVEEFLKKS
ncbi:MAG: helix-turn-helix domain-containing protein [Verrucomicrobiota bacterium]